jgi:CII-binding regulator of phage lambda lysogenization HflD
MSDESNSEAAVESAVAAEEGGGFDKGSLDGESILALLQKAAGLADTNSRYAVEIAQNLSRQLGGAKDRCAELEQRVAELEDAVQFYRDKSERAEQWLSKISSEIQERVIGGTH